MNAPRLLGAAYRRLSSLLATRQVRKEDETRVLRRGGSVVARAEAIRKEALAVEADLGL